MEDDDDVGGGDGEEEEDGEDTSKVEDRLLQTVATWICNDIHATSTTIDDRIYRQEEGGLNLEARFQVFLT